MVRVPKKREKCSLEGLDMTMLNLLFRALRDSQAKDEKTVLGVKGVKGAKIAEMVMLCWWLSGLCVGYTLNSIDLLVENCPFCRDFATIAPSVDSFSTGSQFPDEMFFIMMYYMVTSPVVLLLLARKVKAKCPKGQAVNGRGVLLIGMICMLSFYMAFFFVGEVGGKESIGTLFKLYHDSLFASVSISFVFFALFVMTLFLVYAQLSVLFGSQENGNA